MDRKKLDQFRDLLMEKASDLTSGAETTRSGMTHDESLFPDPVDRALLESNRNFQLRLRDRERRLLRKIQEALGRLETGTFGICDECGEEIETERLRARPVTTLCIECKEEQERLEKMEL